MKKQMQEKETSHCGKKVSMDKASHTLYDMYRLLKALVFWLDILDNPGGPVQKFWQLLLNSLTSTWPFFEGELPFWLIMLLIYHTPQCLIIPSSIYLFIRRSASQTPFPKMLLVIKKYNDSLKIKEKQWLIKQQWCALSSWVAVTM